METVPGIHVRRLPLAEWDPIEQPLAAKFQALAPQVARQKERVSTERSLDRVQAYGEACGFATQRPFATPMGWQSCVAWCERTRMDAARAVWKSNWKQKEARQDLENLLTLHNIRFKGLIFCSYEKEERLGGTSALLRSVIQQSPHARPGDRIMVAGWVNSRARFDVHLYLVEP